MEITKRSERAEFRVFKLIANLTTKGLKLAETLRIREGFS